MIMIRADANEHIGTGHIMRCISIAKAFLPHDPDILFITADEKGKNLIDQNGFNMLCLNSNYSDMDSELIEFKKIIKNYTPKLLLIDSYYVTEGYLRTLTELTQTAYMDDLNAKQWKVDYLINYNIYATVVDYSGYKGTQTKLLLQPQYAPLREEFKDMRKHEIRPVSEVLVSAGGADPERVTEKMIKKLCPIYSDIRFHFIVGALNPRIRDIRTMSEGQLNAVLHINEQHMSELMQNCDIAISAAGSTLYELCATGIPTITYTLADNQLAAAKEFQSQGIMLSAGDCRENDRFTEYLKALFQQMITDEVLRKQMSAKMQLLVDGYGADRLAAALIVHKI